MQHLKYALIALVALALLPTESYANTVYKGRSYPNFNKPYGRTVTPQQRLNINRQIYNRGYNAGVNSNLNNYWYNNNLPYYNPQGAYINTYPSTVSNPATFYSTPPTTNNYYPQTTYNPTGSTNYAMPPATGTANPGTQIYYQNR